MITASSRCRILIFSQSLLRRFPLEAAISPHFRLVEDADARTAMDQAREGVLAGFPTVDFKASLLDGRYHDVDSSALAFEIAAKAAFRDGMKKAGPIILEPIMDVEVTTPQDHVGDVVGDLNRRRGMIQNQDSAGSTIVVRAHVPLKEMFGYISDLRGMTKGRASFTMQFHHYDPVPRNIADEIMAKSA